MELTVTSSARSDVGRVRAVNEDAFLVAAPLFLVADGMGGHARGDAASRVAMEGFRDRIGRDTVPTPDAVLDAVRAANARVRSISAEGDTGVAVAGTTLAGVILVTTGDGTGRHWMVINVGDSRVYAWDGRVLEPITVDHSAVQELVAAGVITAEEAAAHPDRNVITRALGAADSVDPDVWLMPITVRSGFLVCSDGLTRELDDGTIASILSRDEADPAAALVTAALERGGRDNITVLVIGIDGARDDDTARRDTHQQLLDDTRPRG